MALPNIDELEKMTDEQLADAFGKMDLGVLAHLYSDPTDTAKRRDTPQGERTLQMRNQVLSARTKMSDDQYHQYFEATQKA
jgi:hypothetical protein